MSKLKYTKHSATGVSTTEASKGMRKAMLPVYDVVKAKINTKM